MALGAPTLQAQGIDRVRSSLLREVMPGADRPIETVIGMTPEGTLTGARVVEYHETYIRTRGDFLRTPGFQEQFTG